MSARRLAEIRQMEAEANNGEKPSRKGPGRPRESGSRRSVAAAAGVSKDTVRNLESQVKITERRPLPSSRPLLEDAIARGLSDSPAARGFTLFVARPMWPRSV